MANCENFAGEESSFSITESGSISLDIDGFYRWASTIPVYSFIYEEYTKTNPACIHYNDDRPIEVLGRSASSIEFIKTFVNPHTGDELILEYEVAALDHSIDITIQILTDTPLNYRYGVVFPTGNPVVHLYNDVKFHHPLVNFHRLWDRKWPDQTYVDAPIVSIGGQSNCCSIFCPIDYNSQFFFHKQSNYDCVRISTSTHSSKSLNVVIEGHKDHAKEAYVRYFPLSDQFINFWKVTHNKIQKVHGIQLTYNSEGMYRDIKFDPVPIEHMDSTMRLLDEELGKYNCPLSKIGLKEIILCSNLRQNENKLSGVLAKNSNIFIDSDVSYNPRRTIHHEVFHLIQSQNIEMAQFEFSQLSNVPDDMKLDNTFEDMAELFARMMTDSMTVQTVMSEYTDVGKRCEIIESVFESVLSTKLVWKRKQSSHGPMYQDADISIMHPKSHGAYIERVDSKTDSKQVIILYGLPQSGVKLLADYLEKTDIRFISDFYDLREHSGPVIFFAQQHVEWTAQEIINLADRINGRVLWVVRNPRYCEKEEWFDIWVNSYSLMLKLQNAKMVKYESLVMNDRQVLTEVCEYLGCHMGAFKSLIDYDKVSYNSSANNNMFLKYRGYPILSATEYK